MMYVYMYMYFNMTFISKENIRTQSSKIIV